MRFQQKDKHLIETAKEKPKDYSIENFYGVDNMYSLICRHWKNVIPKQIQKTLIDWYHNIPCHPGETRTELSIGQNIVSGKAYKSAYTMFVLNDTHINF